jgi:hypothetical protein
MLPVGSQADSAEKPLNLCLVPRLVGVEISPHRNRASDPARQQAWRDLFYIASRGSRIGASGLPLLHIFANERAMMSLDLADCHGYR